MLQRRSTQIAALAGTEAFLAAFNQLVASHTAACHQFDVHSFWQEEATARQTLIDEYNNDLELHRCAYTSGVLLIYKSHDATQRDELEIQRNRNKAMEQELLETKRCLTDANAQITSWKRCISDACSQNTPATAIDLLTIAHRHGLVPFPTRNVDSSSEVTTMNYVVDLSASMIPHFKRVHETIEQIHSDLISFVNAPRTSFNVLVYNATCTRVTDAPVPMCGSGTTPAATLDTYRQTKGFRQGKFFVPAVEELERVCSENGNHFVIWITDNASQDCINHPEFQNDSALVVPSRAVYDNVRHKLRAFHVLLVSEEKCHRLSDLQAFAGAFHGSVLGVTEFTELGRLIREVVLPPSGSQ